VTARDLGAVVLSLATVVSGAHPARVAGNGLNVLILEREKTP
jgi:hypothetical protein